MTGSHLLVAVMVLASAACSGTRAPGAASDNPASASPAAVGATTADATYPKTLTEVPASEGPLPEASCYNHTVSMQMIRQSVPAMVHLSSVVAVGTFAGFGPARWNTLDGHRPSHAELLAGKPASLDRPLMIADATMLRGRPDALTGALVRGGTSGCDTMRYSFTPELQSGTRYVYFLAPTSDIDGVVRDSVGLIDAWPVDTAGVVNTRRDGPLPLTELVHTVAGAVYDEGWCAKTPNPCQLAPH